MNPIVIGSIAATVISVVALLFSWHAWGKAKAKQDQINTINQNVSTEQNKVDSWVGGKPPTP